jgi:hypothetical protein
MCLSALCFTNLLRAQNRVTGSRLSSLSFQVQSKPEGIKRCLEWKPLALGQDQVLTDDNGSPYVLVTLSAEAKAGCKLKILDPSIVKQTGFSMRDLKFEVRVTPPATVARIQGSDFEDMLLIDAPLEASDEVSFFDYFGQSLMTVDGGLVRASSNYNNGSQATAYLFPVLGAHADIPIPSRLLRRFNLGLSMRQNLGNYFFTQGSDVQLNEMALDIGTTFWSDIDKAKPRTRVALEIRERNIFQSSTNSAFLIGSLIAPNLSVSSLWFPWSKRPWQNRLSRFGFDAIARLGLSFKVQSNDILTYQFGGGLNYKISRRLAVGAGYSRDLQSIKSVGETTTETGDFYFVRLSLLPIVRTRNDILDLRGDSE